MPRPATLAFAGAVLVSLVVLFAPSSGEAGSIPHLDKAVHAAVFGLLAATGVWRFGRAGAVLAACLAYAVGSEVVQHVALAERSGDVLDVAADGLGALAGVLGALVVLRRGRQRGR